MTDSSGKGFAEHWKWAAGKGLLNKNTAAGLGAAVGQVLRALDDWENVDVRGLDVEDVLNRFSNKRHKDFKPKVLDTYKQRFRQALGSYLSYLDDPGGWKPLQRHPRAPAPSNGNGGEPNIVQHPAVSVGRPLVDYTFPLRQGLSARLSLPRDLKEAEVKRLTAFMQTLVVDFGEDSAS
jgi:hypothetical protein